MSSKIPQELSSIAHQSKNSTNTIIPDEVLTNVETTKDFNNGRYVMDSPLCFDNNDQETTPQTDSEIINDSTDSSMISNRNLLEAVTTAPLNALLDVVRHSDNIVIPIKILKSASASTDTTSGLINSDIHNEGTTGDTGKKRPFSDNTQNGQNGQNGIQSDVVKAKKVKSNNGAMHIPEKKKGISNWALNLARTTQKTELRQCTSKKKLSRKKCDQWDRAVAYLRTKNHYVTPSIDDDNVVAPSTSNSASTSSTTVVTSHLPSNTVQPWRCVMCNHMMSGVQSTNCSRCNHLCTHVTIQSLGVLPVGQGTRIYPKPLTASTKPGWQRVSALSHEKVAPDRLPCDKKSTSTSSSSQPLKGNATFTAIADIGKNKVSRMDNSEYVCKSSEMYVVAEKMLPRSADTIKSSKNSNPKGSTGSTGGSNTLSGSSTSSSSGHTNAKNSSSHQSTASLSNNTGKTSSSSSLSSRVPNNVINNNIATSSSSTSSSRTSAPPTSTSTSSSTLSINSSKSVPSSTSSSSLVQAPLTNSSATSISGSSTESFIDLTNDDDDEQCVKDKTKLIERTIPAPVQTQPSHHQLELQQIHQEDEIRFQKYRKLKEQQQQHQLQLQQHQHQQQRLPGHSSSSLDNHGNQSSSTSKKRNYPFSPDDDVTSSSNSNTKNKQTKPFESAPKGQKYPPLTASPRSDKDKSRSSQPISFAPTAPRPPLSSSSSSSSSTISLNAYAAAKTSNGQPIRLVPSWTPSSSSSLPPPLGPFLPRSTQNFSTSQSVGSANDKIINQNTRFCRRSVPLAKSSHSLQSKDSPESFNKLNVDDFSTG